MHNESSEDVANQKSKNIWLELCFWRQVFSAGRYACVCVCVYCCILRRVSSVCSLNCQWDLRINKKKSSKNDIEFRIRIKYFSLKIIFSFTLNSRCQLTFFSAFSQEIFHFTIKLQPDYTLNAAAVSVHTQHTHTHACMCEIFKFINYAILWFWGVECAKILFYTRLCPRHENAQFIFLPACHAHSSKHRDGGGGGVCTLT